MIGAVGYWYKGDYYIPLLVMEELNKEGFQIIDLSGAIKSITFLSDIKPKNLIILASAKRGEKELRRYSFEPSESPLADWAEIYANSKAYYSDIDTFLRMLSAFRVIERAEVIECEVINEDGELSDWGKMCKDLMKSEVSRLLK